MKGSILFRSHYGNTKQVAEAIARQVTAMGHEAVVQDVREKFPELQGIDFVMVGSPTRFGRADGKALAALKQLKKKGFTKNPVAVFDTYGPVPKDPTELEKSKKWLFPGAAGKMQNLAKEQGLSVYPETLRCEVETGTKFGIAENQLEKTASFTKEFLSVTAKK